MARKLVPKSLNIRQAILNVGRASAIVSGFANNDISRIGSGMHDEIAEPYREQTIPGIKEAKEAGLLAGAAGVAISGAGPSLVAIVDKNRRDPKSVARAIVSGFRQANIKSKAFTTEPAPAAKIIEW
jgi:homoserine kinase